MSDGVWAHPITWHGVQTQFMVELTQACHSVAQMEARICAYGKEAA